jgi:hypothetical protein
MLRKIVRHLSTLVRNQTTVLPVINYSSQSTDFNQQAFAALKKQGGFILDQLEPGFSSSTAQLLRAYDDFLKQPDEIKNIFTGQVSNLQTLQGFYPYGNFIAGSKTCHRYLIIRDSAGNIANQLPVPYYVNISMQEAADQLHLFTDDILRRTLGALDYGFCLQNKFINAFQGYGTVTVTDHYVPMTQEKLQDWALKGQLSKTEDGRIEAFVTHKDIVPLTFLTYYGNQCTGLELKTSQNQQDKTFKPLTLRRTDPYHLQAVVIAGRIMENLTDGMIEGMEHRVVIKPMEGGAPFQRRASNTFFILNPKKHQIIKPLVRSIHPSPVPAVSMSALISQFEAALAKTQRSKAIKELKPEELVPYPKENEIDQYETAHGTTYERRMTPKR